MGTDNEIKIKGFKALIDKLGEVEAEKFISLISKEPFDYTEWRTNLFEDISIEQLSAGAMRFRDESKKNPSV